MPYRGVAISGKAGAGKDTFARHLQEELFERGLWGVRVGFADAVKEDVLRLYGLTKADPGGRERLIEYSNARRAEQADIWIARLADRLESLSPFGVVPVIADLRYQNEYEWASRNGFVCVRVDATGMDREVVLSRRGEERSLAWSDHVSEVDLDDAAFDVRFWNPHGSLSVLPHFAMRVADRLDGTEEELAA